MKITIKAKRPLKLSKEDENYLLIWGNVMDLQWLMFYQILFELQISNPYWLSEFSGWIFHNHTSQLTKLYSVMTLSSDETTSERLVGFSLKRLLIPNWGSENSYFTSWSVICHLNCAPSQKYTNRSINVAKNVWVWVGDFTRVSL